MSKIIIKIYKSILISIGRILPNYGQPFVCIGNIFRCKCAKIICGEIGKNVYIMKGSYIAEGVQLKDNAVVGINCVIHRGTVVCGHNMMGHNVSVFTQNHKYNEEKHSFEGYTEVSPVIIGEYSLIGQDAIILPGVTIESHSIIGADAVVTKDAPAGTMVAGNPATIKKLLMNNIIRKEKIK